MEKIKTQFVMHYYDTPENKEKSRLLNAIEIMFDDQNNQLPEQWYQLTELEPGSTIKVTIEQLK